MRPMNTTAEKLIDKAKALQLTLVPGFFGTNAYCAGLRVTDPAHAFGLGALLGAEFSPVVFDSGCGALAFPNALVQA
jgi:hypothetical protein